MLLSGLGAIFLRVIPDLLFNCCTTAPHLRQLSNKIMGRPETIDEDGNAIAGTMQDEGVAGC